MATATQSTRTTQRFRAKVTGRHAITLPAELCRRLHIATGDVVEFEVVGEQAILRRAPEHSVPEARGMLSEYFSSRDEVQRFIEEERRGWEEEAETEEL